MRSNAPTNQLQASTFSAMGQNWHRSSHVRQYTRMGIANGILYEVWLEHQPDEFSYKEGMNVYE